MSPRTRRLPLPASACVLEPLEPRAFLAAGPVIASLTVAAQPLVRGDPATLTAVQVIEHTTGARIRRVEFFADDSNDGLTADDTRLGRGKRVVGTDDWRLVVSGGRTRTAPLGHVTLLAVATDSLKQASPVVSTSIEIVNRRPTVKKLKVSARVAGGNPAVLQAQGVADLDGKPQRVAFYRDIDGDSQPDAPELLGEAFRKGGWKLSTVLPAGLAPPHGLTGQVRFLVVAFDDQGGASQPREALAAFNARPQIGSFSGPASVPAGQSVTFTVRQASDPDGVVKKILIYTFDDLDPNDRVNLGQAKRVGEDWVLTRSTRGANRGLFHIYAVAIDNFGAASEPVTIDVQVT